MGIKAKVNKESEKYRKTGSSGDAPSPAHKLWILVCHLRGPKPEEGNCQRALYDVLLTVERWKRPEGVVSEELGARLPAMRSTMRSWRSPMFHD